MPWPCRPAGSSPASRRRRPGAPATWRTADWACRRWRAGRGGGAAAGIPVAIDARPARGVAVVGAVQRAVAGDVRRPRVHEIEEDAAFLRRVDAGRGGGRGGDGLQCLRPMLQRGPLGEAAVAAAVHADAPIAPGLRGDPVDHRRGVVAVAPEGNDGVGAASLAARIGDHADVTARGHLWRWPRPSRRWRRR